MDEVECTFCKAIPVTVQMYCYFCTLIVVMCELQGLSWSNVHVLCVFIVGLCHGANRLLTFCVVLCVYLLWFVFATSKEVLFIYTVCVKNKGVENDVTNNVWAAKQNKKKVTENWQLRRQQKNRSNKQQMEHLTYLWTLRAKLATMYCQSNQSPKILIMTNSGKNKSQQINTQNNTKGQKAIGTMTQTNNEHT